MIPAARGLPGRCFLLGFPWNETAGTYGRCVSPGGVSDTVGAYEGLCRDHWPRFWPAHLGAYLACHRRRAASGDGTLVRSHHHCRCWSLPLGCAFALALAAIVSLATRHPVGLVDLATPAAPMAGGTSWSR